MLAGAPSRRLYLATKFLPGATQERVWVQTAGEYTLKGRSTLRPYNSPADWTPGGFFPHQII
jgi:hypothetical protein